MTNSPPTGSRAPEQPSSTGGLRQLVILVVAVGIGLAFAHGAASGLWPGLTGPWLIAVRILAACGIASLVARFLGWLLGIRRERRKDNWGINLNAVHCPECGKPMPALHKPDGIDQRLWGGWACPDCGCRVDKWGKAVGPVSPGK
jgi:hypothetical protein